MIVLHGRGYGDRPVMARAAKLSVSGGRATLDETLLATLARRRADEEGDLDLILVAEDPALALLMPLPEGAHLIGVVGEREMAFAPPLLDRISVVSGILDALTLIAEGFYLIIDPARDRVLVEPSAEEVARLQKTHRPRILLGAEHTPAWTQGGAPVAVWAWCRSLATANEAMATGADGVVVEGIADRDALEPIVRAIGGGDLALIAAPEEITLDTLLFLAGRCVLHWCVDADRLPMPVADLRAALKTRFLERQVETPGLGLPRIAALLTDRLPVDPGPFDIALSPGGYLPADVLDLPPFYARVDAQSGEFPALAALVAAGARGVIVDPEQVGAVKDAIRTLP